MATSVVIGISADRAFAVGLNYVEASEFSNLAPVTAIDSSNTVAEPDNLWNFRNDFGSNFSVYESGVSNENSPQLTQTISNLTGGNSYDVYAVYWTDDDENWTTRTGLTPGNLTFYSWMGNSGSFPVAGSTQGVSASLAVWDTPPPATAQGTSFIERRPTSTESFNDPLVMLLGYAGTATANASGQVNVLIDDNASGGGARRTWLDGVAYVAAGTPIAATTSFDRDTGVLTLINPTAQSFQIKSYHIESAATGALNATTWTRVSSTDGSWSVTMPADPANTPFATILSEDGGGNSIALAANGGTMSFGNIWNKSPFDHLRIYLTLADDSVAILAPNYTGARITNGDLDANGVINLADYQALLNGLHTTPPMGSTRVDNYRRGDMSGDGAININDFTAFRAAYDAANGAGAFVTMLALVPEPSSLALVAAATILVPLFPRRRSAYAMRRMASCVLACIMCLLLPSDSNAATLLKVDVDHPAGDGNNPPVPPGDNTVSGFNSFALTAEGAADTTQVVNGYTITVTAMNASHMPQGVLRTRDRGTPTTAPTLNQLYDDFIFAATTGTPNVGVGGGMDLAISGGALLPNTQYGVSIYAFDTGSTGVTRTASWLDGNSSNALALTTTFAGANSPTTDDQYKFNGVFKTDVAGRLLLRARGTLTTTDPAVFLNGLQITDELPPQPVELTLRINTTTGAVSIVNEQTVSIDMSYYEIRSVAGSINLGGWTSLDDAEGGDPIGSGWDEAPASNANIASEANLLGFRTFAPGQSVSLGNAFTVGGTQDLQLTYLAGLGTVTGDYNGNSTVDAADYVVWRKNLNTSTTLPNDSTPGMVTQDDYSVWRANFGRTAAFSTVPRAGNISYVSGTGARLANLAVPEPNVAAMLIAGLSVLSAGRLRGRHCLDRN